MLLALAFEEPQLSVIRNTPACPTASRPSHFGIRNGAFAPSCRASSGSQTETSEGSSSTILKMPALACSMARTAAEAASSTWVNDQTAVPPPITGSLRARIASRKSPPGASDVPGPYRLLYRRMMPVRPESDVTAVSNLRIASSVFRIVFTGSASSGSASVFNPVPLCRSAIRHSFAQ